MALRVPRLTLRLAARRRPTRRLRERRPGKRARWPRKPPHLRLQSGRHVPRRARAQGRRRRLQPPRRSRTCPRGTRLARRRRPRTSRRKARMPSWTRRQSASACVPASPTCPRPTRLKKTTRRRRPSSRWHNSSRRLRRTRLPLPPLKCPAPRTSPTPRLHPSRQPMRPLLRLRQPSFRQPAHSRQISTRSTWRARPRR